MGTLEATAAIWDFEQNGKGALREVLKGHTGRIRGATIGADGLICATLSDDGTVKVWDGWFGDPKQAFQPHNRTGITDAIEVTEGSASWEGPFGSFGQTNLNNIVSNAEAVLREESSGIIEETSVGPVGVTLTYLETFITLCGGRERLENLKTGEVCEFVKSRTRPSESLCDVLRNESTNTTGRANWFVSHTWHNNFLDFVDALTTFFEDQNILDVVFWVDLFSLPQHERGAADSNWLKTSFTSTISSISNVVMVLAPWKAPFALTRAWCIYELYTCATTRSNFRIAIPPLEMFDQQTCLLDKPAAFFEALSLFRSKQSDASIPEDRVQLHETIEEKIGFLALDRMLLVPLYENRRRVMGRILGDDHHETLRATEALATLYFEQNNLEVAESLYIDCWERRQRLHGNEHPETLSCLNNLDILLRARERAEAHRIREM
ncbi:hypothetical protein HDV00_009721 [Rhizophlyctis rosea]|nr:hypothetical protein HDV00_009721 [Rhizophlyctis rosea]